jgi:hypothetical protein
MGSVDLEVRARSFIAAVDLPPSPFRAPKAGGGAVPDAPALAVGQNLVEFGAGADPAPRQAMADALLLAQLAADKAAPETPDRWYDMHRTVLGRLGFQSTGLTHTAQDFSATDSDLHTAILPVIAAAFAGAAVPAIVMQTLEQLSAASEAAPWIQLFERESRRFQARQFQVTLVEGDATRQTVAMLGFVVDIARDEGQVLFFRAARDTAAVERLEARFTCQNATLLDIAPDLAAKLADRRPGYIAALEI